MLTSFIIFLGFIALIITPLAVMNIRKNQKSKQMIQNLITQASVNQGHIDLHESLHDIIVGLDKTNRMFYYYIKKGLKVQAECINLKMLERCKMQESGRLAPYKGSNTRVTESISLGFYFKDKQIPAKIVELYNSEVDGLNMTGQTGFAEKWSKLINEHIK
jgi:hypothetical protein